MASLIESTIRGLTKSTGSPDSARPFVPVFGDALLSNYESHWQQIHTRTQTIARYAKYATQAQIPLHDYWLSEVDSFRSFSKEVVSMGDEVMPAMSALRQSVDKVKQNMAQLEEVLLILLANKEEQTRQEWEAKKEKELADQKARFLSTYKQTESRFLGADFHREKAELEESLRAREKQLKAELAERMALEKKQVAEQLERAKEIVQIKAQERSQAVAMEVATLIPVQPTAGNAPPDATSAPPAASTFQSQPDANQPTEPPQTEPVAAAPAEPEPTTDDQHTSTTEPAEPPAAASSSAPAPNTDKPTKKAQSKPKKKA